MLTKKTGKKISNRTMIEVKPNYTNNTCEH